MATTFCAGRSESAERRPLGKRSPVTLTMWIMQNSQHNSVAKFNVLIRAFTQEHPHVKVAVTLIPWAKAWDKIQGAIQGAIQGTIQGGPAPDIVQVGTTWVATMAATGKLRDITGEYNEKIFPRQVVATTTIEDQSGTKPKKG